MTSVSHVGGRGVTCVNHVSQSAHLHFATLTKLFPLLFFSCFLFFNCFSLKSRHQPTLLRLFQFVLSSLFNLLAFLGRFFMEAHWSPSHFECVRVESVLTHICSGPPPWSALFLCVCLYSLWLKHSRHYSNRQCVCVPLRLFFKIFLKRTPEAFPLFLSACLDTCDLSVVL